MAGAAREADRERHGPWRRGDEWSEETGEIVTMARRRRREEAGASGADQRREFLLSEADAVANADGDRAADGEEVHGIIEWYDRKCIKVNRENGGPNLMIYKPAIKYMFKEGENQK